MSRPFIIWTMRRTGGTTLTGLLMRLSEHPNAQHEPFNADRQLGRVVQHWRQSSDAKQLAADFDEVLAPRPLIKHCYEIFAQPFNAALLAATERAGYRHVILDRRGEVDRILSLELAKITGAWGPKQAADRYDAFEQGTAQMPPIDIDTALKHMGRCHQQRQTLEKLMHAAGVRPHVVYFEDIYADPDAGRAEIARLLEFLELDPSTQDDYDQRLSDALLNKGQNSAKMMGFVPNIDEARKQLEKFQGALKDDTPRG